MNKTYPYTYLTVTYYDRKMSHKGQGVQTMQFNDNNEGIQEAKEFAAKNQLYSNPCVIERRTVTLVQ